MKVIVYSTKEFEKSYLVTANKSRYELFFTSLSLSADTASLAKGYEAVMIFTGDDASAPVIDALHTYGIKYIAIRAAGYDNVDLCKAHELGMKVANVPEYSPYAIAEHTIGLILALNRKLIIANRQVHQQDFRVDNLIGFDLHRKKAGIIGTGRIGSVVAKILHGFGCELLGFDSTENPELIKNYRLTYTDFVTLCKESDIITIHIPLNEQTRYLINKEAIQTMKTGVMLINTGRGAVINTAAVTEALENKQLGCFGMDVYEKEKGLFFYDHSIEILHDPVLNKLLLMDNVLITPHQAFATKEAITNISETSFHTINCWDSGELSTCELS
jgi:D-lactate dehydrogenase